MKKFTKLFLSCAAVTAVTAAVASSAMAADTVSFSGVEYEAGVANDTVTITVPAALASDASKTLLILEKGVTLQQAAASPSTNTILQVQQYDGALTDADATIDGTQIEVPIAKKDAESADDQGTYKVYMGGTSGTVYEGSFTLGAVEALVGDANGDDDVTADDATITLQYAASNGLNDLIGENYMKAAYSNGDTDITADDATEILKYAASQTPQEYTGKVLAMPAAQ